MSKNHHIAAFVVLTALLLALLWWHTGRLVPPSGPDAIWFNAGLFTLLLGKFITEYRFAKPYDVFLNCVTVFVSVSTLSNPPNPEWWAILRWSSVVIGAAALLLSWDPGKEAKLTTHPMRAIFYQLVTQIGRSEVIFSMTFLLALLSYFDFSNYHTKVFAVAWGIFLLAAHLNFAGLGRVVRNRSRHRRVIGVVHSMLAPSIVFCRKLDGDRVPMHEVVGFAQSATGKFSSLGLVIGERASAAETRIAIALLKCSVGDITLNERTLVTTTTATERFATDPQFQDSDIEGLKKVVGTVVKGTTISQMRFELFGVPDIRAGSLLSAGFGNNPVFYQVFDGLIEEETAVNDSSRAFVEGLAEQVGRWDDARGGFETHDWVAKECAPVRVASTELPGAQYALNSNELTIGGIPSSGFPANIGLDDLILYHSAILGVTGSGKSFLTYSIAEACADQNVKVVCLDPTGDYQRYLHDAVLLPTAAHLGAFLKSADHSIGIVETADAQENPIVSTHSVAKLCLDWCRRTRPQADILNPKPRVLVILEEAHLLVPEWNFNSEKGMQEVVNKTSQIVLQARKYGLGFLVVSQRTANVTKSILNQCNTIISFQAFDETGFDFLKNYMGAFHVRSLPNLKSRHGIVVGKASKSRRPVMVHFTEQDRGIRDSVAPTIELPKKTPEKDSPAIEEGWMAR